MSKFDDDENEDERPTFKGQLISKGIRRKRDTDD